MLTLSPSAEGDAKAAGRNKVHLVGYEGYSRAAQGMDVLLDRPVSSARGTDDLASRTRRSVNSRCPAGAETKIAKTTPCKVRVDPGSRRFLAARPCQEQQGVSPLTLDQRAQGDDDQAACPSSFTNVSDEITGAKKLLMR